MIRNEVLTINVCSVNLIVLIVVKNSAITFVKNQKMNTTILCYCFCLYVLTFLNNHMSDVNKEEIVYMHLKLSRHQLFICLGNNEEHLERNFVNRQDMLLKIILLCGNIFRTFHKILQKFNVYIYQLIELWCERLEDKLDETVKFEIFNILSVKFLSMWCMTMGKKYSKFLQNDAHKTTYAPTALRKFLVQNKIHILFIQESQTNKTGDICELPNKSISFSGLFNILTWIMNSNGKR